MDIYANPPGASPNDLNIILRATQRRRESSDCLSVFFERPRLFRFAAGGWIDIRFLARELATGRTFSLSSSPTEPELRITFKKGFTPFKAKLETTVAGDIALITQHGSNELVLDKKRPAVFIAGGIGIAPFRSMLKETIDCGDRLAITLIHVNQADNDAPFREEILTWQRDWPELRTHYVSTNRAGRLTLERLRGLMGADMNIGEPLFYIAGPPAMVNSSETLLARLGVADRQIRRDQFDGY